MTKEAHPDIIIGPLTLKWTHGGALGGFYIGRLNRAGFRINRDGKQRWTWLIDTHGAWFERKCLNIEDGAEQIRGFLTALGIIGEEP